MACLIVMDGPVKGHRVALEQPLVRVGRREGNDWVLADGSVSGLHCEIEHTEAGFVIRDLGSTNGTKVNNEPIKEQPLYRNDIILIGEVPVMIEGDDVPQTASQEPYAIPRTTIVIQPPNPKRNVEAPKEFVKKSNSNKVWISLIAVLLLVIAVLLVLLLKGWFGAEA